MDLYLPGGEGARPAVMLVHGGGWRFLDKGQFRRMGRLLARSGYVAASINYRLVPAGEFPNAVQDTWCALSYLRNHSEELGIDPSRIAVMGYSAGGHLASMVGLTEGVPEVQPTCAEGPTFAPRAVIDGAGPSDLASLAGHEVVRDFVGGRLSEIPDIYAAASPVEHVHPGAPPFLLIHGSFDLFVPRSQAERLRDALVAEGVDARLLRIAGQGHLFGVAADPSELYLGVSTVSSEAFIAIADFLERTVGRP